MRCLSSWARSWSSFSRFCGSCQEEDLRRALRERGLVDEVMKTLGIDRTAKVEAIPVDSTVPLEGAHLRLPQGNPVEATGGKRFLCLTVLGGKAFLDHASDLLENGTSSRARPEPTFTLHVHFKGQRLRSQPVRAECDPAFSETFPLELPATAQLSLEGDGALSIGDPIEIAITSSPDGSVREKVVTPPLRMPPG